METVKSVRGEFHKILADDYFTAALYFRILTSYTKSSYIGER